MTIAEDPKWLAAAVRSQCYLIDCAYPECKTAPLRLHCGTGWKPCQRAAEKILTAVSPLIDAAIAEAVGRERESNILPTTDARKIAKIIAQLHAPPGPTRSSLDLAILRALTGEGLAAAIRARGEPAP